MMNTRTGSESLVGCARDGQPLRRAAIRTARKINTGQRQLFSLAFTKFARDFMNEAAQVQTGCAQLSQLKRVPAEAVGAATTTSEFRCRVYASLCTSVFVSS